MNEAEKPRKPIDPAQRAVALKYAPGDFAPAVVAKGKGYVAEKIIEKGEENKIPVYKDEKLVRELTNVELGQSIPPELYEVVAQVLVFIGDLDKRWEKYRKT